MPESTQIIIFIIGSLLIALISWRSLRDKRVHGFYRFFVFEVILGLVVLKLPVWFDQPLSWNQLISWILLIISAFLAIHGFRLLKRIGQPDESRPGADLLGVEKTTALVTSGAYRYIRHPLYASLLLLAWGLFFKQPDLLGGILALAASVFLYLTARNEERENLAYFGEDYRLYMQRTRMFIPFIF